LLTGPNSLAFELFVLVVVRVLRIRADLAPVGVLTLLDAILLHHQLALLIRHLLTVLLVDRVAHLARIRVTFFHWYTMALLAGNRVTHFVSDFLAVRSSHRLAVLLRNLVALLPRHQVALLLRHVHAVLLRHRVAVLGWHQLALLLWHVVTLLLWYIVADRPWHKFAFLPRNILALVCGHLVAFLMGHFFTMGH